MEGCAPSWCMDCSIIREFAGCFVILWPLRDGSIGMGGVVLLFEILRSGYWLRLVSGDLAVPSTEVGVSLFVLCLVRLKKHCWVCVSQMVFLWEDFVSFCFRVKNYLHWSYGNGWTILLFAQSQTLLYANCATGTEYGLYYYPNLFNVIINFFYGSVGAGSFGNTLGHDAFRSGIGCSSRGVIIFIVIGTSGGSV